MNRIAALLALAAMAGCTQAAAPHAGNAALADNAPAAGKRKPSAFDQTVVPGSYIVNASGDGDQAIRRVFAEYGVTLVRPLGNGQFEVRLSRDPGLSVLKNAAAGSGNAVTAVQPNFVYRSN